MNTSFKINEEECVKEVWDEYWEITNLLARNAFNSIIKSRLQCLVDYNMHGERGNIIIKRKSGFQCPLFNGKED